jgi:XPB/Ssl2-like helicase family protein
VSAVKERQPDFQRPAGDYDSWYIRDAAGGQFLRGFENWERVDGALVRWLIEQPLAWLGAVEVAPSVRAFRLTPLGAALLGLAGWPEAPDALPLAVNADGLIRAPALASGYDRFQLARISDWLSPETEAGLVYPYRLTPAALARAAQKGISAGRVVAFLERAAAGQPALPALAAALRRWEVHGAEAGLRESLVLRLSSPELLESLRRAPQVANLLGESLGPKVVEVRPANLEALRQALAELGILLDEN